MALKLIDFSYGVTGWLAFIKEPSVPTISMFYGILILMYFYDNKKHSVPHIHAAGEMGTDHRDVGTDHGFLFLAIDRASES